MDIMASASIWDGVSRFARGRSVVERHAIPLYAMAFGSIAFVAVALNCTRYDIDQAFVVAACQSTLAVLAFAYAARWIGFGRSADFIEQVMLLMATGIVCAFCSVILASTAAPLADPLLNRLDRVLFAIDRSRLIADLHMSARTLALWRFAYESFAVTPLIAMVLLALTGQRWRAWALLTALIACAMVSMAFLLILPAFGTPPYPYAFASVLQGARDGSIHVLDGSVITGIITFPSMHAADAVILAVAFGWLGRWAVPLVLLNVAMFFSALIVGGHYAVDLIGGAIVGLVCIMVASRLHRRIDASAPMRTTRRRRPLVSH